MSSFAWWDARVTFWNTIEILLAKLKETIWRLTKTKLLCKQSANLKEKWWRYFQSYSNVLRARGILKFSQKKSKLTAKGGAWKVSVFGVFLVCIFRHLDWIWRDTPYLSIFSPNAGKYWPEKLRIRTFFTQWDLSTTLHVKHRADTQTKQLQRQFNMRDCF